MTTLVFVYGSLMRGGRYHELMNGARFEGQARTPPRYTLVDRGRYPAMVEGGGTAVSGELYRVDEHTLAALDRLEGHPDEYRRMRIALESGIEADSYLMPADEAIGEAVASGDWRRR